MNPVESWAGKRVVVIGGGRSGSAAAHLLLDLGAEVTVTDVRPEAELPELESLDDPRARLACGGHPDEIWSRADAAVVSPGIAPSAPPVQAARSRDIRLIAEIELAAPLLDAPVIAITGSNGKSTVTSMVGEVLRAAGRETAVCGNIGVALTAAVRERLSGTANFEAYVVELSSFQCETIDRFRPDLAAILNLTPDHLDRHGSFDRYAGSKLRLLKNSTAEDWFLYNHDDEELVRRLPETLAKPVPFSLAPLPSTSPAAWIEEEQIWWRGDDGLSTAVMAVIDLKVIGPHNWANACAALALGVLAGVDLDDAAAGLCGYQALEHRMERCGEVNGVQCINDSKATNVDATVAALSGFDGGVWLILGGRDKGASFQQLRPLVAGRVARVLLIGEATSRIAPALAGAAPMQRCKSLERAVATALSSASPGDVLLLSPACTSFDQYSDFEARGRHFKQLIGARSPSDGEPRARTLESRR